MDIAAWLRELGLECYETAFRSNDIDVDLLSDLTDADLEKLGVASLAHRKKLLRAIEALRPPEPEVSAGATAIADKASLGPLTPASRSEAERRQLTVMFIDLVGSTALSGRLDPEDMREVIRAYQTACAEAVDRWGGHVARYIGDGVLAYFGWPQAHEDDAERAVRAGLQLVQEVAGLEPRADIRLQARVGVATGHVVVGDLISEGVSHRDVVSGASPNLAARLQAVAAPGSVVISPSTRQLVGGLFELTDLGPQRLKGFAEPLTAWRVAGETRAEGRFEARHTVGLTPFVGREEEIAFLLRRWEQARDGEGQVVLLSGEPGIGKSRLVRELCVRLEDELHVRLLYQCSPHHTTSPLHPLIEQLERAAAFERDDLLEARLDKLEALLARGTDQLDEAVPLIAALLGLSTKGRYPALDLLPQRQKQRTLEVLVNQLEGLTAEQPVLWICADVHWIDPTTQELLGLLIDRIQRLRLLAIISFRPEFTPPWSGQPHVSGLALSRLGRRDGAAMVEQVVGDKALPDEVSAQIAAKTDGVPLFVEELTKAVLESGLLSDAGDRYELTGPLPPLAIPSTLHDSLLARLDRLARVKEVAQIGAAIGREFSHTLLVAVADRPEAELQVALDQLISAELVFRHGRPPDATYSFKHALIQDAAYGTLLKSRRQQLHARIARGLEELFPYESEAQPELLAHHYAQAGFAARAIEFWCKAGQHAIARSAMKEAVAHLTAGIDLLHSLPESQALEPDLQLALGGALAATEGHGMPRTGGAYERAVDLARSRGRKDILYPAFDGVMTCHFSRGELVDAVRLGRDFLTLSRQDDKVAPQIIANMDLGVVLVSCGELHAAKHHFHEAISLYDAAERETLTQIYSYDPMVICQGYLAWVLLALGYPDQAIERSTSSITTARSHQHPLSLGFAITRAAAVHQLRRDVDKVGTLAADLHTLAAEQGFGTYIVVAAFYRGWTLAQGGQTEEGLHLLQKGIAAFRARRDEDFFPHSLFVAAEAVGRAGHIDQALKLIAEGLERVERNEEHWFEAELHRFQGEALLALSPERADEIEPCYHQALAVARGQSARFWELRAATSLARLWRDQGRRAEAYDLLAPIHGWFTEGFDTADLKDAKTLLGELA